MKTSSRRYSGWRFIPIFLLSAALFLARQEPGIPAEPTFVNSLGMKFARIEPGTFRMGVGDTPLPEHLSRGERHLQDGDPDEQPVHTVTIKRPFYVGVHEVANADYEKFDPGHRKLRGKLGFSKADDEAVVFVNWHEAVAFCNWLSQREGLPYRLPTEAEWEYSCRAGTTTWFHTGSALPEPFLKNVQRSWYPHPERSSASDIVSLRVGQTPPNAWGLFDMHGNVEEWCHDWYGPYLDQVLEDPVGYVWGDFKVTRGGSHSTELYYLRSGNRSGTLPEDSNWLIGFRVVLGEMPLTKPFPAPQPALNSSNVRQEIPEDIHESAAPDEIYFAGPKRYVNIPANSYGPLFSGHNHDPAIVECPNGDLLAVWYTCVEEPGREVGLAASRLRYGAANWEPASVFWDAPDRNDHAPALWFDGGNTVYQFVGLSAAATWGSLATVMRTSTDNGATWSRARLIISEHGMRHMPIESVFQANDGEIILPVDAVTAKMSGSAVWISRDQGETWEDPGGTIAGIHAGVVQLQDGSLYALGRGESIEGRMPKSVSTDMGRSWSYSPSAFPPLGGGQRLALFRLEEGPLFLASFARKLGIRDASGRERHVNGLFAALSVDEGRTWPFRRLISDEGPTRLVETMDGHLVPMDAYNSEPVGYLSVCQTADGVVHLISSRQHYAFNLAWLQSPPPAVKPPRDPVAIELTTRADLPVLERAESLMSSESEGWRFEGRGCQRDAVIRSAPDGVLRVETGEGQQFRLRNNRKTGFGRVDSKTGFAVEFRIQVEEGPSKGRGVNVEAYDGQGARYAVTITTGGVFWYEGFAQGTAYLDFEGYSPVTEGLDNTESHTYRLSVREDRVVQIYRDGRLLGVRRFEYRTPREPYLVVGAGSEVKARLEYISYDLTGPSCPEEPETREN